MAASKTSYYLKASHSDAKGKKYKKMDLISLTNVEALRLKNKIVRADLVSKLDPNLIDIKPEIDENDEFVKELIATKLETKKSKKSSDK